MAERTGRLVVIMEERLTPESRKALHKLLKSIVIDPEVTFVAGLTRAAMLGASEAGGPVFYNTCDYIPLTRMVGMMPWRQVWMVCGGRVYGG